jgi:glycosyltransferase involved in cell wall biosynthesis
MDYKTTIYTLGFLGSLLSFLPFKRLKKGNLKNNYKVSVIIPARNEEENLKNILVDLKAQTYEPFEIIVVNDESEDNTTEVAKSFGVEVIKIEKLEENIIGKPYACLKGFEKSKGDIIIFFDADVRLKKDVVEKLLFAYENENAVISVWPYHTIGSLPENFSFMFNLIGTIALNNNSIINRFLPVQGLFGPCILIDRKTYEATGGHKNVLNEVVEDVALGKILREKGFKLVNMFGREDVQFRMYKGGFKDVFLGWSKNFGKGAISIHPVQLIIVFLYITALFSSTFNVPKYTLFALMFASEILVFGRILGNFNPLLLFLYPLHLFVFLVIFVTSLFKTFFVKQVEWKGRKIKIK